MSITAAVMSVCLMTQGVSACKSAVELRRALGYGPQDLTAMGVGESAQQQIVSAAATYYQSNQEALDPLLAELREARQDLRAAYETDSGIEAAEAVVTAARADVIEASESLATTLLGYLTSPQQTLQDSVVANADLDIHYRTIALSPQQVENLHDAQRERDRVLLHGTLRQNPAGCQSAWATFDAQANGILSLPQKAELADAKGAIAANAAAAQRVEESNCAN